MRIKTLLTLAFALCVWTVKAQTIHDVAVSPTESYTDHLQLTDDSKDMDVMVKFAFDEPNNRLTVSLISYRNLFAFHEDCRYKQVISRWLYRLKSDKLPYVTQPAPGTRIRMSMPTLRKMPKPRRKQIFHHWVEYDGMQPVQMERKLIEDCIEQTFEILPGRSSVGVTLRDIMVLDPSERQNGRYSVVLCQDIDRQYNVRIVHSPCYDTEEQIEMAKASLQSVHEALDTLRLQFGDGEKKTVAEADLLNKLRSMVLKQYPRQQKQSKCADLQYLYESYNLCLDTIAELKCYAVPAEAVPAPAVVLSQGVDPSTLYAQARQIDDAVNMWQLSNDDNERRDMLILCTKAIKMGHDLIARQGVYTAEQHQAKRVFDEAEQYYRTICLQEKHNSPAPVAVKPFKPKTPAVGTSLTASAAISAPESSTPVVIQTKKEEPTKTEVEKPAESEPTDKIALTKHRMKDEEGNFVIVKLEKGEYLPIIAKRYFGSKAFWSYIYDVNSDHLKDPSVIYIGTKLYLPDPDYFGIDANDSESVDKAATHGLNLLRTKR